MLRKLSIFLISTSFTSRKLFMEASYEKYLQKSSYIDIDNSIVRQTAADLVKDCQSDREKALKLFRFVRDEIKFGWTSSFYAMKASDVLRDKVGYCMTKSTLLIALLRCNMIPARQVFVDISSDILLGYGIPGPYVDHCYTEVYLNSKWIKVDSYVIDSELYDKAKSFIDDTHMPIGLGIHSHGTSDWDGDSDSLVQFVDDGLVPKLSTTAWGEYEDIGEFYKLAAGTNNGYEVTFPLNFLMYFALLIPNLRVSQARKGYLGFMKYFPQAQTNQNPP
jgi:hypothetical protein